MKLRTIFFVLASFFCASAALAQTVTMGNEYVPPDGWVESPIEGTTYIDLLHPASVNGVAVSVQFVYWMFECSCPDAVTIKFARVVGDRLTVFAERGPFDSTCDAGDTGPRPLSPPVPVKAGDLIGFSQVSPGQCGGSIELSNLPGGEYLMFRTDISGTVALSDAVRAKGALAVRAWGDASAEYTARIIPVVGSTTGLHGAHWRTAVQLLNPHEVPAVGRLVFRSEWGAGDDASIPYSVAPGATRTISDVGAAMGRVGRLGSLEVMTTYANGAPPVVVTQIVHDLGGGNVVGTIEEAVVTDACPEPSSSAAPGAAHILTAGTTGYLVAPPVGGNSRFNIGVRTLDSGATIEITLHAPDGQPLVSMTKTYEPDRFEQRWPEEFPGTLTGGESIRLRVIEGSAIVYATTTDNVTNDPTIQFAHRW